MIRKSKNVVKTSGIDNHPFLYNSVETTNIDRQICCTYAAF